MEWMRYEFSKIDFSNEETEEKNKFHFVYVKERDRKHLLFFSFESSVKRMVRRLRRLLEINTMELSIIT